MNKEQKLQSFFERFHKKMESEKADVLTMFIDPKTGNGSFAIKYGDVKGLAWLLHHAITEKEEFKQLFNELMKLHIAAQMATNEQSD